MSIDAMLAGMVSRSALSGTHPPTHTLPDLRYCHASGTLRCGMSGTDVSFAFAVRTALCTLLYVLT
eukprot:2767724-Rhodomonas_salina.11